MLRVLWVEVGMIPREVRAAIYHSDHTIVETIEIPDTKLYLRHKLILKHWISRTDVIIICDSPVSGAMPLDFGTIYDFALAFNKVIVRIEWFPNSDDRSYNIIDRPKFYSRGLLKQRDVYIDDALLFVLDAYEGAQSGLILPDERELFIFNNIVEVKPSDLKNLLNHPEELQRISPRLFEELVADLLVADGWNVELVKRLNSTGPDIIATTSRKMGGQRQQMIVECKRQREDRPVGFEIVSKVMYWVNDTYRSTMGMIATSSRFTSKAIIETKKKHRWRLDLRDQKDIASWMRGTFLK